MNKVDEELIENLKLAASIAREKPGLPNFPSEHFDDAELFALKLDDLVQSLRDSSQSPLKWLVAFFKRKRAKLYFYPTFDYDDFCSHHEDSVEIGNSILSSL